MSDNVDTKFLNEVYIITSWRRSMKKIKVLLTALIALIFIGTSALGSLHTRLVEDVTEIHVATKDVHLVFSPPEVMENHDYYLLGSGDDTEFLLQEGFPIMPYMTQVMTFPVGTRILKVEPTISTIRTLSLNKKIAPGPKPTPYGTSYDDAGVTLGDIYGSAEPYPDNWFTQHIGVGLTDNNHMLFLSFRVFPCRYSPADDTVLYLDGLTLTVTYELPRDSLFTNDAYDLVVIAPSEFSDALQPLVAHKEALGIRTHLVTLNEIYDGTYFDVQGRDDAETLKYFIKECLEQWGIKYVLLVGGRHGGSVSEAKWWCPVRYTYLDARDGDKCFLSDLYFADIYKYVDGELAFEDWDSNDNGVFGEWRMQGKEPLDMFPDVSIGRWACRTTFEVTVMVDKIKTYESSAYGTDWSKQFVGIAGDTFPGDQWYDGEESVLKVMEYLAPQGYEFTTLFTSNDPIYTTSDMLNVISEGCGLLNFEGHGTPTSWATHKPQSSEWDVFINVNLFPLLHNKDMYPICVVGGCSNSKFDITALELFDFKNLTANILHGDIGLESFSWWLARKVNGGSIATIGCTSYGYGKEGDGDHDGIFDGIQYRGGFIDIEFFRIYAQEGKDILGETHMTAITNFLIKFPPMTDQIDAKTVEEWALLGDPSLKIGGYP